jgi:hypothetical protein
MNMNLLSTWDYIGGTFFILGLALVMYTIYRLK